jgi:hypothetical protein
VGEILLPTLTKEILCQSDGPVLPVKKVVFFPGGKTLYGISVRCDTCSYEGLFLPWDSIGKCH